MQNGLELRVVRTESNFIHISVPRDKYGDWVTVGMQENFVERLDKQKKMLGLFINLAMQYPQFYIEA